MKHSTVFYIFCWFMSVFQELTGKQTKAWYRVFSAVLKKDNVLNDPNFKPFEGEC